MIAKAIAALTVWGCLGMIGQRALAQDYPSPTDEHLRLSLGAMHVSTTTTLRADSSAGIAGSHINGEEQFGLDKSDFEPKFQAVVRVATRHRLTFDYFTLDRTGRSVVGATPLVFRNVTYLPNDPLQANLSLRMFGIAYGYSFWHGEKLEIAATLGVHATDISASAKVQTQTRHVIQTDDQAGPVPTLGMNVTWVASKRFYLDGSAQYLKVHVSTVAGSLGLYTLDALYRYRRNVALGLGYTDVRAHITSMRSSNPGAFDFNSSGPEIFLRVAF